MISLPIDVVPGTDPPRFRWTQRVSTPLGPRELPCEGCLPPGAEQAVAALVAMVNRQQREVEHLRLVNEGLAERVAAQSELLSKRAEADEAEATRHTGGGPPIPVAQGARAVPQQQFSHKKAKGAGG